MKRPIVILTLGALLCLLLSGAVESARKTGDRRLPGKTGQELMHPQSAAEADVPVTQSAGYEINWQSINGGGAPLSNASYSVNSSVGQSAIGYSASTNYDAGIGYWYGATGGGECCSCPYQSDWDEDNFITPLDLSALIDILFAGVLDMQDECCPKPRGDFDCDAFDTPLDLGNLIDYLFASGPGPCDPCVP